MAVNALPRAVGNTRPRSSRSACVAPTIWHVPRPSRTQASRCEARGLLVPQGVRGIDPNRAERRNQAGHCGNRVIPSRINEIVRGRRGITACNLRRPRLLQEVAVGRGDGSYARLLARPAKLGLLGIDDWMLAPVRDAERRDLTEVIEDHAERAFPSTPWTPRARPTGPTCNFVLYCSRINTLGPLSNLRSDPVHPQGRTPAVGES